MGFMSTSFREIPGPIPKAYDPRHAADVLQNLSNDAPAALADEDFRALLEAAAVTGAPHHLGVTASSPGFYGAQDRHLPGFPLRDHGILEDLQRQGVKNIEMEASCLFSLAGLAGWRAGAICAVYANRHHDEFIRQERKAEAEASCIDTALEAFHALARIDERKAGRPYWHPGLA